jgi:mRNA interferase RelE/StbE
MGRGEGRSRQRGPRIDSRVEIESRARREFLRLPPDVQERIIDAVDDLVMNPRPSGAKRLVGRDGYRLRLGEYRILYTVDDENRAVRVYRTGHRRDIYSGL